MARKPMTDQGTAGDRQRVTTYVRPDLWKQVRLLAVERDLPTWAIVEAAVSDYLARQDEQAGVVADVEP